MKSEAGRVLRNFVDTTWSARFAYAIGLMASDGCLDSSTKEIHFVSKDRELVENFCQAIAIQKELTRSGRGGVKEKKYWRVRFKSRNFHDWLVGVGITPRKSKTIKAVDVPNEYFADFLRGLYDGDGTFWTWWDKRWPNSFGYTLGFSSASHEFVVWLKQQLTTRYGVKGYVHNGDGAYTIRYVKGDTRRIFTAMYGDAGHLFLTRKREKIQQAFEFDDKLKEARMLQ